jgi:hypothetical protein
MSQPDAQGILAIYAALVETFSLSLREGEGSQPQDCAHRAFCGVRPDPDVFASRHGDAFSLGMTRN